MGLTMLLGVLRMPINLWEDTYIDKIQRQSRYIEAADLILNLSGQLEAANAEVSHLKKADTERHKK